MPRSRLWAIRLTIVAVFFAAVSPTLRWLDFFHAEENVVIATALEMRRGGDWLVPTLQGKPRTIKPPLTVWITASAIRDATLRGMSSSDASVRAEARRDLAFEARWPTVLAAGLMLVAVFELARAMGGVGFAVVSTCVCGTCWYFLVRQGSKNTVDLQLALWVTIANACLAWAVLRGRVWSGLIGAGIALGLATMSKGPAVPLLQSVVPVALFVWVAKPQAFRLRVMPIAIAVVLMLVVGLWWYGVVYLRDPAIAKVWWAELTRRGANELRPDAWHHYLRAMRFMFPWLAWLIVGIAAGVWTLRRRGRDDRLLAFFLALVPLAVMTLFDERKERYLIPLIGPLSIVAAWPLWEHLKNAGRWGAWEKIAAVAHWVMLAALAIGLPLAGARAKPAWYTWPVASMAMVIMGAMLIAGLIVYRRRRDAIVVSTVLVMIVAEILFVRGFSRTPAGLSDMRGFADAIWEMEPGAQIYSSYGGDKPGIVFTPGVDLAIYMNRTVPAADDVMGIVASDRRQIVLRVSRKNESEPAAPAGWAQIKRLKRDNGDVWQLWERR